MERKMIMRKLRFIFIPFISMSLSMIGCSNNFFDKYTPFPEAPETAFSSEYSINSFFEINEDKAVGFRRVMNEDNTRVDETYLLIKGDVTYEFLLSDTYEPSSISYAFELENTLFVSYYGTGTGNESHIIAIDETEQTVKFNITLEHCTYENVLFSYSGNIVSVGYVITTVGTITSTSSVTKTQYVNVIDFSGNLVSSSEYHYDFIDFGHNPDALRKIQMINDVVYIDLAANLLSYDDNGLTNLGIHSVIGFLESADVLSYYSLSNEESWDIHIHDGSGDRTAISISKSDAKNKSLGECFVIVGDDLYIFNKNSGPIMTTSNLGVLKYDFEEQKIYSGTFSQVTAGFFTLFEGYIYQQNYDGTFWRLKAS